MHLVCLLLAGRAAKKIKHLVINFKFCCNLSTYLSNCVHRSIDEAYDDNAEGGFDNEQLGKINQQCDGPAESKCGKVQLGFSFSCLSLF